MPKAKAFKHWVTSEVLPALRKNGVYETVKAQQHIEQLEATNERLTAAIKTVSTAKEQLAEVIDTRNDMLKQRDDFKVTFWNGSPCTAEPATGCAGPMTSYRGRRQSWTAALTS